MLGSPICCLTHGLSSRGALPSAAPLAHDGRGYSLLHGSEAARMRRTPSCPSTPSNSSAQLSEQATFELVLFMLAASSERFWWAKVFAPQFVTASGSQRCGEAGITMGLFFFRRSGALQVACVKPSMRGSNGFGATPLHALMLRVLGGDCSTLVRHHWGDKDFEFRCKWGGLRLHSVCMAPCAPLLPI